MFATKTVCRPGAYIELVPAGLLVTLQYNRNGLIEKITLKSESGQLEELNKQLFTDLAMLIPNTIALTGGTTWVEGVFYSDEIPFTAGTIPYCLYDDYKSMITSGKEFKFYGSNVESKATNLRGPMIIRNWLEMSGFKTLPGIVVPQNFTEDTLKMLTNTSTTKFQYPYISGYGIFENLEYRYAEENLVQMQVKSISRKLDEYGCLNADITTTTGKLHIPYSEAVLYDAQAGSCILTSGEGHTIISARKLDNKVRPHLPREVECPICHKKYSVPVSGVAQCDDVDCASRLYPQICRMTAVFKLPTMEPGTFLKLVADKKILALSDVLDLPEYKDLKFKATIGEVLSAATPTEVCVDASVFDKIAHASKQNIQTLMYYLNHTNRLIMELGIHSAQGERFAKWLDTGSNILTIKSLLDRVEISEKDFVIRDAAPIFRGRKFILTGAFKRGNYSDIVSILANYGAEVITDIDAKPDCIVVGGLMTNIDGNILRRGDAAHILRYDEDNFFESFGIDNDLARSNLL